MSKTITLTFTQSYGKFGGCFDMSTERDGKFIAEHTVQFDRLPVLSQLRFLVWAMSNKWAVEYNELPNYHREEYDNFYEFTLSEDGQDTDELRYFLGFVAPETNSIDTDRTKRNSR